MSIEEPPASVPSSFQSERRRARPSDFADLSKADRVRAVHRLTTRSPAPEKLRDTISTWYESGDAATIPALIEALELDPDVAVQRAALAGLARIVDSAAIPGLLQGLRSTDRACRCHAVLALGRLRARPAVPALVDLLSDQRARVYAAEALVAIRDERALEPLRSASRSGWPWTRHRLRRSVLELDGALGY